MWECKKCHFHNSNSNKKCHGENCNVLKSQDMIKVQKVDIIKKPKKIRRIYDFCSVCQKDVVCIETKWKGKTAWKCTAGNHRPAFLRGKSKPFPPGLLELLEEQDRLKQNPIEIVNEAS